MAQLTTQQAFDLAMQFHQAGRLSEADRLYRQILAYQPQHAEAMHFLGVLAHQAGRNDIAVELIHKAIGLRPNYAEAYGNLGLALKSQGRTDEAIEAYRQAIALRPQYPEAHSNLGVALTEQGQLGAAIAAFGQAIALNPNLAESHSNLGNALRRNGQLDQAIAAYQRALSLRPGYPEAHSNLADALRDAGRLEESIAAYHRAIALKPNYAEALSNLGNALRANDQLDEAIAVFRRAILARPNSAEIHSNLGVALTEKGLLDEAVVAFQQALDLDPRFAEAHFNLPYALLAQGKFRQGWEQYEWQWTSKDNPQYRPFAQPLWDGQRFDGRTLLLHGEQGFGDTLQFIRYLPMAGDRGGKIILEVPGSLKRLLSPIAGDCEIVASGEPLPAFDIHSALQRLPHLFDTTLANIPGQTPYLAADAEAAQRWRDRLAEHHHAVKIGLAWAGNPAHINDRRRSMAPANLAPLGKVASARFFSLQKNDASSRLGPTPNELELVDWTHELNDFADTAALIANLDLVLSVDTSVVHLAGAMGKPVWTLLPFAADWRWLTDREDSPWYPSMRLFRQTRRGDWESVVGRVADELSRWVASRA